MINKIPPPEREAFEREIHDLVANNGDLSAIARLLQKDHSAVSKAFNPYCEDRINPIYCFTLYLWAFDYIRDGLSDDILAVVCRERDKWRLDAPQQALCPAKLTADIGRQFSEYLESELLDKSFDEQIKECLDIEIAAAHKKADLIQARNSRHFGTNGGKARYSDILPPEVKREAAARKGK